MTLPRHPLRDDVHRAILDRVLAGSYAPGTRLKDTVLAYDLGVSRTPVREALMRLEWEGVLSADMGRGFRVRPLAASDVRDAYPMLWTLEQLALRSGAPLSDDSLGTLNDLDAETGRTSPELERQLDVDARWHDALVASCGNARLLSLLATLRAIATRYERVFLRRADTASNLTRDHREIARALTARNVDAAITMLERHWRWRMDHVLAEITGR
ncbi:MAG TPA: GntR family transcriptional regulator [Gemmatimonadaceae bacterium]|nr:GntR family transcriptional regulator [Gemmatimonadaceae bacterium]